MIERKHQFCNIPKIFYGECLNWYLRTIVINEYWFLIIPMYKVRKGKLALLSASFQDNIKFTRNPIARHYGVVLKSSFLEATCLDFQTRYSLHPTSHSTSQKFEYLNPKEHENWIILQIVKFYSVFFQFSSC